MCRAAEVVEVVEVELEEVEEEEPERVEEEVVEAVEWPPTLMMKSPREAPVQAAGNWSRRQRC
jgi:hypothetical protein